MVTTELVTVTAITKSTTASFEKATKSSDVNPTEISVDTSVEKKLENTINVIKEKVNETSTESANYHNNNTSKTIMENSSHADKKVSVTKVDKTTTQVKNKVIVSNKNMMPKTETTSFNETVVTKKIKITVENNKKQVANQFKPNNDDIWNKTQIRNVIGTTTKITNVTTKNYFKQ